MRTDVTIGIDNQLHLEFFEFTLKLIEKYGDGRGKHKSEQEMDTHQKDPRSFCFSNGGNLLNESTTI